MGYHEAPCHLCGVSFKTVRIRTESEPRSAAWAPGRFADVIEQEDSCFALGCKVTKRRVGNSPSSPTDVGAEEFEDVLPSGVDSEGNEVSFEAYMGLQFPDDVRERENIIHEVREVYNGKRSWLDGYWQWYLSKVADGIPQRPVMEDRPALELLFEHIAGPHCVDKHGYNGNAISVDEMRGCSTLQCMVSKDGGPYKKFPAEYWVPEPDDEDFERETSYFLTGIADRCGSWEDVDEFSVYPARHNYREIDPYDQSGFDYGDIPVHPYCLETFRRVSQLRLGTMNIAPLADWWNLGRKGHANHPAVERGRDQWWQHIPGDEWVVAQPLEIPALESLLEAAKRPQKGFDARNSPFDGAATFQGNPSDPFHRLPAELRDMVLASLESQDIANLRLASRSFRLLPYTLWHDLMKKEMPWIWEAWTDRPYSYMACTTRDNLKAHARAIRRKGREALNLPEEQRIVQEELVSREDAQFRRPRDVQHLDRLRTDWYQLYCGLKKGTNINGLHNRERIWKAIEFVVRRMTSPEEDWRDVREKHLRLFPHNQARSVRK